MNNTTVVQSQADADVNCLMIVFYFRKIGLLSKVKDFLIIFKRCVNGIDI